MYKPDKQQTNAALFSIRRGDHDGSSLSIWDETLIRQHVGMFRIQSVNHHPLHVGKHKRMTLHDVYQYLATVVEFRAQSCQSTSPDVYVESFEWMDFASDGSPVFKLILGGPFSPRL